MNKFHQMNFIEKVRFMENLHRQHPKGYPTDKEICKFIDPKRLSAKDLELYNKLVL